MPSSRVQATASRFTRPPIRPATRSSQAYNLAYQMSQMPQNLAARYQGRLVAVDDACQRRRTPMATPRRGECAQLGGCARRTSAYNSAVVQVQSYPRQFILLARLDHAGHDRESVRHVGAGADDHHQHALDASARSAPIRKLLRRSSRISNRTRTRPIPASRPRWPCSARSTPPRCFRFTRSRTPTKCSPPRCPAGARAEKQQIDAQNRLINQAIYFQQNFSTTMQHVNSGVSRFDPLHFAQHERKVMR